MARVRGSAAPELGAAIEAHLQDLALPRARLAVTVGGQPPADAVEFGLGANPGEAVLPLAKVASGGELARAMLAVRLVLSAGPPTLVFDEVDAGIGGEAAVGVGRALARLGGETGRQVIVVTHLAQVAAFAATHVAPWSATAPSRLPRSCGRRDESGSSAGCSRVAPTARPPASTRPSCWRRPWPRSRRRARRGPGGALDLSHARAQAGWASGAALVAG